MRNFALLVSACALVGLGAPAAKASVSNECNSGLCGTPEQSGGGGCGCGCGGSILVANTDLGDTYQYADDFDNDGFEDEFDNCPFAKNSEQADSDGDEVGDACDSCLLASNPSQGDLDGDGIGDACDSDRDNDGMPNASDNCSDIPNPSQQNADGDGAGDVCDDDDDNDGLPDGDDPCRLGALGVDDCEDDVDGDGWEGGEDNCPSVSNSDQFDLDGDGFGNLCDADVDGDEIQNGLDNCQGVFNPGQRDIDRDGLGDEGLWGSPGEVEAMGSCDAVFSPTVDGVVLSKDAGLLLALDSDSVDGVTYESRAALTAFSNQPNEIMTIAFEADDPEVGIAPRHQRVVSSLGGIINRVELDFPSSGEYIIRARVENVHGEVAIATYAIVNEGDGSGGCASTGVPGGLLALAGMLFFLGRRRQAHVVA